MPFANPYEGIRAEVTKVIEPLIEGTYHFNHAKRHARTLEVLLDNNVAGKVLEIGTSSVIPIALKTLAPDAAVEVTDFFNGDLVGEIVVTAGKESLKLPCYSFNLEEEPFPCEDERFDFVICSEVLEHMDVDPMYMLAEINRVLKPGGTLILTTPNSTSTQTIWKVLRGYDPYFFMQYHPNGDRYRHNYEYSLWSIRPLIAAAGFDAESWTENSFEPPTNDDVPTLRAAGYKINDAVLGDNIFVVAKKVSGIVDRYPSPVYLQTGASGIDDRV
jgi:ubiquinone/menaquinone biosynthesis C-methylase UbiE